MKLGLTPSFVALFLKEAIKIGPNTLISGPTRVGKTTTAWVPCEETLNNQRVVTYEEVLELDLKSADCVAM